MSDFSIRIDTSQLDVSFPEFNSKARAAIDIYGKTAADKLEGKAKANRPWTDRTSRARQGLTGSSEMSAKDLKIVLAHTVDYGIWLELAHEKKYAIVEPTVRLDSNEIFQGLTGLLEKIK